jgi:hypothetical protein
MHVTLLRFLSRGDCSHVASLDPDNGTIRDDAVVALEVVRVAALHGG